MDEQRGGPDRPGWDKTSTVYQVIGARRIAFDSLMWQIPALALAAQAFLLTIAFGGDSSRSSRLVAGALATIVAVGAVQTMHKHRANETTDSLILERLEEENGIELAPGVHPHARPDIRGRAVGNPMVGRWVNRHRSARLWAVSLSCFALAGLIAGALALFDPSSLEATGSSTAAQDGGAPVNPERGRGR